MSPRWTPQRYAPMADYLFPASRAAVAALGMRPGDLLVDSATGTGNAVLVAVEHGVRVVGLDSAAAQIAAARSRCPHPDARFVVADAQHLPLPTARADAAVSVFGVIFAADPGRALAELVRCVKPGGGVAFTSLRADGWPTQAREVLAGVLESTSPPFPDAWTEPDTARTAAGTVGLDEVDVRTHELVFSLEPGRNVAEQVTARMGGLSVLRAQLESHGRWPVARARLDERLTGCLRAAPTGPQLVDEYLLVLGRRQ